MRFLEIERNRRDSRSVFCILQLSEPATLQFEEPVDTSIFIDYLQYVETPIDLSIIDKKIEADDYKTPEDFEYDGKNHYILFCDVCRWNQPTFLYCYLLHAHPKQFSHHCF